MMLHRDWARLEDIMTACARIRHFTSALELESFAADARAFSAVLYQLIVIGEATKNLSFEFRAENPQIPWRQIAGMRDRLVHDYQETRVIRVWDTVMQDIPVLEIAIQTLLNRSQSTDHSANS